MNMCPKPAAHQNDRVSMFLDLPRPLRHHIYEEAGLLVNTRISLTPVWDRQSQTPESHRRALPQRWMPKADGREACQLVRNLLLVCRVVHDEVLAAVLSRNDLVIGPTLEQITYGLWFLNNLSPYHCSVIRKVGVTLQHFKWGTRYEPNPPSYPLKSQIQQEVIAAWEQAACHLLAHTVPGTLKLRLACDTSGPASFKQKDADDGSTARAIVRPFLQFPGKLANLELRLATRPDQSLSHLALETVCAATGRQYPASRQGIFRFFDLPAEIRRQIMEYTDLVTPEKMVEWSSQEGYRCPHVVRSCEAHNEPPDWIDPGTGARGRADHRRHRGCGFTVCEGLRERDIGHKNALDCCRARHSAFKDSCQCWSTPRYLMLVSRAFYYDAQSVFFSSNRISVRPPLIQLFLCNAFIPYQSLRLDAARFLTMHTWPQTSLKHLKYLELVVGPFEESRYHSMPEQTFLDWDFAMQHLADHANAPNLTVSIYLSRGWPHRGAYHGKGDDYKDIHALTIKAYDIWLRSAYERFLTPLKRLRHLGRLFVRLEACWEKKTYLDHNSRCIGDMEVKLEQFVMGADYDSTAKGKCEEGPASWLEHVWKYGYL